MISSLPSAPETEARPLPFLRDPIAIVSAVLFLAAALRFFNYCEDDVFIPMRYALNFWRGHGLVMNPGERVDGCTSPLQLWLCVGLLRFLSPDQALGVLKILGILLGLGVLARSRTLARLLLPDHTKLWRAAPLLLVIQPTFTLSMVNGLETSLAAFFLVNGLVHITSDVKEVDLYARQPSMWERLTQAAASKETAKQAAFWFCAAALTRPELALTFPAIVFLLSMRDRRIDWRSLAIYSVPLIAECVFRYLYYGDWLPNTYYAKQLSLRWGFDLGRQYIEQDGFVGVPAIWMTMVGLGIVHLTFTAKSKSLPSLVTLVIQILFLLRSGGDWMIDGRFCMVVAPVVAAFLIGALQSLVDLFDFMSGKFSRIAAMIVPVTVAGLFAVTALIDSARTVRGLFGIDELRGIDYVARPHAPFARWMGSTADGRLAMADWIGRHAQPGQTVLVGEVGVVPIANMDIDFIDVCGLTDATIAHMQGYPRGRGGLGGGKMWMTPDGALPHYIHKRKPEWVALLWSPDKKNLTGSGDSDRLYVPVEVFPIHLDGYTQYVATWRRRDIRPD